MDIRPVPAEPIHIIEDRGVDETLRGVVKTDVPIRETARVGAFISQFGLKEV